MLRRAFIILVTCAALWVGVPARASTPRSVTSSTVAHGARLTLTIPTASFPANAIVQADLRLQNVSPHPIAVAMTIGETCVYGPHAYVFSRSGREVSPPAFTGIPDCPGFTVDLQAHTTLRPGAQLLSREYLLLRGPSIRARQTLLVAGKRVDLFTPPLHVKLSASDAPAVSIQGGAVPIATLHPAVRLPGPVVYVVGYTRVAQHGTTSKPGFVGEQILGDSWHEQSSPEIRALLPRHYVRVVEWHAYAGWLNHSAAAISFKQP